MKNLLPEIISDIFMQLYSAFGPAALVACLRCSRRWHDIAEPLIYRDVSLTNSQLAPFLSCARARQAPLSDGRGDFGLLLRSLTITIDAVPPACGPYSSFEDQEAMQREGSAEAKELWALLGHMATLIASSSSDSSSSSSSGSGSSRGMANLATFSLRVSDRTSGATGFWIPRPLIARLIASLPLACVNVEVDTQGHDFAEPGAGGGFAAGHHLCDSLRAVLPRLHHFRLRVKVLCPAVFAAGFRRGLATDANNNDDGDDDAAFAALTAAAAPALKTCVVNCVMQHPGYGGPARLCGTLAAENPTNFYWELPPPPEARIALVRCLRRLCTSPTAAAASAAGALSSSDGSSSSSSSGCYPAIQRLWLLDMQLHDDRARGARVYAALNRRDIAANRTSTMPFDNVWGSDVDTYMMRMGAGGGGREVVSSLAALQALAEGETWIETWSGARLPAASARRRHPSGLDGVAQTWRPLPVESAASYAARHPDRGYELWSNEAMTGIRLLEAVERDGLTDTSPVKENTPPGWKRRRGELVRK